MILRHRVRKRFLSRIPFFLQLSRKSREESGKIGYSGYLSFGNQLSPIDLEFPEFVSRNSWHKVQDKRPNLMRKDPPTIFIALLLLTNAIGSLSQTLPAYLPKEGLVAWYPFDRTADDRSGNGNHLRINGPVLTADRMSNSGSAYLFNGTPESAQWLEPADSKPFATEQFTYSVWISPIYFNPMNSGGINFYYQGVLGFFPASWVQGPAYMLSLFQLDNAKVLTGNWLKGNSFPNNWSPPHSPSNNAYQLILTDQIIEIDQWVHLAVTFDGKMLTLYANGKRVSSISTSVSYANQSRFIIGGNVDGSEGKVMGGFRGAIDDIGFWNRALSEQELIQVYKSIGFHGTVTDIVGNLYNTVLIGDQEWMAENLRTTKFANGDPIAFTADRCEWSMLSSPAYSYPENESKFNIPYGKLYNWYAVADERNLCPSGWHAPSDMELKRLSAHLDSTTNKNLNALGSESNAAAAMLKDSTALYWEFSNTKSSNSSGFSFLPAGHREFYGAQTFTLGRYGYLWTTTSKSDWQAWLRYMDFTDAAVVRVIADKRAGLSVRCIKGEMNPFKNTAPTDIALSLTEVPDNAPTESLVGTITALDVEGGSIYFSLAKDTISTDNAKFKIGNRESGESTLILLEDSGENKSHSYKIRISASDGGGLVTEKEFKITVSESLPKWISLPFLSLITGIILSLLAVIQLTLNYRNRKPNDTNQQILFEKIEQELVQTIFENSDHALLIDEINGILGTSNKSVEVQKKHRSDVIKEINRKYRAFTDEVEPLLEKQRLENDKRLVRYFIHPEKYKKISGLITLSQQKASMQNGRS